jgi:hypothetical protein
LKSQHQIGIANVQRRGGEGGEAAEVLLSVTPVPPVWLQA